MKKILLCCFAMIMAMMAAISPALAADGIICTEEGFFPDPVDCTKFYRCVNFDGKFTRFDLSCGPETIFDPELITCIDPLAADSFLECLSKGSSSIFTPESNTSAALTEFVPGKSLS